MKRFCLLFSLLLLAITVNSQRVVYHHTYARPHRVIYERPYVDVMYVEKVVKSKQHQPNQIVINNYVVNDNDDVYNRNNRKRCFDEDEKEFVSIDTNECLIERSTFDYDDMWHQTIWFKRGSYRKIRTDGKIALENVAMFLQEHNDAKIVLEGYASRRYGTYDYNKSLASNRLKTISSYLVNVYHINWDRIEMKVIGTDDSRYDTDEWNQCVVINCKR